jgi:type I restriction enzyme, S subunit
MSRQAASVPLGSVTTWLSGGTPDRANAAFWAGSIPWISAATLKRTRIYDSDQRITESAVRSGSKLAPQGTTLVLVRGMALHREVRAGLAMRPVSFNQDVKALIPRPGLVPQYLTYSLHAQRARILELVSSAGSGTGVLDTGLLKRLPIWLPDSREQERIVRAIEDVDSAVEALERLIAKKQAIKQGMMQQLITGNTRLPGFTGPWHMVRLVEFGQCLRGVGYDPRTDLSPGDRPSTVRLLRANNVQNGNIVLDDLQFVHERRVNPRQLLHRGDIVICMANGSRALVGKSAYFDTSERRLRYTFGAFMGAFRVSNRQCDARFVAELLKSKAFRDWLDIILAGSSINNLRPGDIENFQVAIPSHPEQTALASVFQDAERELDVLRARLVKAKAIKQGMMQELLTGRTCLPVVEAVA